MQHDLNDPLSALAAILQSLQLASSIALTGEYDKAASQIVLDAIYQIDSASTQSLYPTEALTLGLQLTARLFQTKHKVNLAQKNILQALLRFNTLARRLNHHSDIQTYLSTRLKQAIAQRDFFQHDMQRQLLNLADMYLYIAQKMRFDFALLGQRRYLHDTECVTTIRALLLAALRACVLWRQLGGNLWNLWRQRQCYSQMSLQLLSELCI